MCSEERLQHTAQQLCKGKLREKVGSIPLHPPRSARGRRCSVPWSRRTPAACRDHAEQVAVPHGCCRRSGRSCSPDNIQLDQYLHPMWEKLQKASLGQRRAGGERSSSEKLLQPDHNPRSPRLPWLLAREKIEELRQMLKLGRRGAAGKCSQFAFSSHCPTLL